MKQIETTKIMHVASVVAIYIITFLVVYDIFPWLTFEYDILNVFVADVIATVCIFLFSVIFNNSSIYDPYWSVAPPVIVIYLLKSNPEGNQIRQYIILLLVLIWSVRLTLNWIRSWQGFQQQDWRYISIAEKTGIFYWPVSFLGIHLMPTIFVFLGCLPAWYSMSTVNPLNIFDIIVTLFTFGAILTEWIADEQLIRFRKNNPGNSFMQSGLWAYSRHPNYLGEISFWTGLFLFALSCSGFKTTEGLWTAVGFLSMIILFKFISVPLMEKRNVARRPGYTEYIKKVPALLPRIFK